MEFRVPIEMDEEGWYVVTVPHLRGCVSQGRTEEEAKRNLAEAIGLHPGSMARDGVPLCPGRGVKEVLVAVHG